ncbi:ABC transporter substrate-binding protein [Lachnotalea sp. AF33-28]|jgi:multiple sugar transport system substrate-binding protein|uniref:ABC transporter substrate-binding protein n=1 Tax=Lachnotalea sp. AF33-28 TaxID=2292046 RepID=UPI0013143801|nr:sugar ABC transporter substrate-binding protein [Lachnotalea sp. AF33-28]
MLKRFTAMFLVTVMLLCLTACSSTPKESTQAGGTKQGTEMESVDGQQEEEITLTFWMEMTTPELDEIYQAAVDRYMQSNPNIKIEYLGIPGNAADAKSKLEMAFSANAAPDVFQCFMPEFITRGNIIPLTDYFEASDLNGKISKGSIEANIEYDPNKKDLYAIPSSINVRNFWIRTDWYKENSIEIPETWDEFFDSVKKLADPANNRYGTTIRGGAGGAQNLEYMMYAYSGITEAFDENGKSTINDPLNVEFCEKYLSLYKEYTAEDDLNKGWTEVAASFQSGTTASIFHNLGSAQLIDDTFEGDYTKFEIFLMPPSVKGYSCHPVVDAQGYSITAGCSHPEEAWDFIEYMVSDAAPDVIQLRGGIPVEEEAAKAEWVTEKPYYVKSAEYLNDPELKFFKEPLYLTEYRNILANVAEPKMQEAMTGLCGVQEFLDEWAEAMTEEKANYDSIYAN